MDQHQVTDWDLKQDNPDDFGVSQQISLDTAHGMLGIAMAWLNDVNCRVTAVPGLPASSGATMVLFEGYLVDAITAKELWLYLVAQCDQQAKQCRGKKAQASYRIGFAAGVQHQVKDILKDREKIVLGNGKSLVVCKRNLVTEKYGQMRTSTVRQQTSAGYSAGYSAGCKTGLNRQATTKSTSGYLS